MREMELTTLLTTVQDIQNSTKNRQQKNGRFAGDISTLVGVQISPRLLLAVLNCFRACCEES